MLHMVQILFLVLATSILDWQFDEQSDVLLFKKLTDNDKNFRGNYMEIARRMCEAGWDRNNNQCRQQV